jgi:hypothetical protein
VSGGQGDFHKIAGLFWPQGDPDRLRHAAQAWRQVAHAIDGIEAATSSIAGSVKGQNHGPAIDAFGAYWSKWEGGQGYFGLTSQSSRAMADALEKYAAAIDDARRRVEEIAATAATVLAVGIVLTIFTVGISDVAAGAAAGGLVAAAAAVGVELSSTVAAILGTVLTGAAIGALASITIDTAIQVERVYGFHDQQSFDWGEFAHSAEIGALTGGVGSSVAIGARAVTPFLTEALPAFAKTADVWGSMPSWAQAGIRGTLVGGGVSAGMDQLATGHVNPFDVGLGAASGALGDIVGTRMGGTGARTEPAGRQPVDGSGYVIQQRDLQFLGISRDQVGWWSRREAPLGMTPTQYQDFRSSLLDTLRQEGIPPDHVDIRLHGSSANFFSSPLKPMPAEADLAGHPDAAARLHAWLGDDPNRPAQRPFDTMYKLGLDPRPSDYDVNISSTHMVDQARTWWDSQARTGELISPDHHGYLDKEAVAATFPRLNEWHIHWSQELGRDVSYAVFPSEGPWNTTMQGSGVSVHFRDTDWVIHRVK